MESIDLSQIKPPTRPASEAMVENLKAHKLKKTTPPAEKKDSNEVESTESNAEKEKEIKE